MVYTLNGVNLGSVTSENYKVTSDLNILTFPLSKSKDTEAFDYAGVKRIITITGILSDTTVKNLMETYIVPFDQLQSGDQATVVFHSDLYGAATTWENSDYNSGNINVKVQSFTYDYRGGSPLMVEYTLELIESV